MCFLQGAVRSAAACLYKQKTVCGPAGVKPVGSKVLVPLAESKCVVDLPVMNARQHLGQIRIEMRSARRKYFAGAGPVN
jgi:hypothetical protein